MTEREITSPVALQRPDGTLNPDAVGWTRHPFHDTTLSGWGRTKRWEYWCLMTPGHVVALTVSSLDYAAVHQVWVLDRATDTVIARDAVVPLAARTTLPASLRDLAATPVAADAKDLSIRIDLVGDEVRLRARTDRVVLEAFVAQDPDHEALGVVVPWNDRRFQYTVKDVARRARGRVRIDGTDHALPDGATWAVLDHGRGRWPYEMTWNWGAGSGVVGGRVIGVQVGGRWTDGTGATENALLVDGRLHKNSDELVWEYDREDWSEPWRVHDAARERVDLTFTPFHVRTAITNLLVISGHTYQGFGTWTGWMTDDAGERVRVDGVEGWAEEAHNRW